MRLRLLFALGMLGLGTAHASEVVRVIPDSARRVPSSPFRVRLIALASDPAHDGKITPNSLREAYVGLRLERQGRLQGIEREPSGAAEFRDRSGRYWDIKGFNSEWPANQGGFVAQRAATTLSEEFAAGTSVILDRHELSSAHDQELADLVHQQGWDKHVLWYPAR